MFVRQTIIIFVAVSFLVVISKSETVKRNLNSKVESYFQKAHGRIQYFDDNLHEVIFAIKPRNMDKVKKILYEVSDPLSSKYGQHLTRDEVSTICSNPDGTNVIRKYLESLSATIKHETLAGEYIIAETTIKNWEFIFKTRFHKYELLSGGSAVFRVEEYTVDDSISHHLSGIYNLIDFPKTVMQHGLKKSSKVNDMTSFFQYSNVINPATLNAYYNITSNIGLPTITQAVYSSPAGSTNQFYSASDIKLFQKTYGIPNHPVDIDLSKRSNDAQCKSAATSCYEANVDLEYIMAIAQNTTTSLM